MRFDVFESLVNTEGFQTGVPCVVPSAWFESLVNTEGFQTKPGFCAV